MAGGVQVVGTDQFRRFAQDLKKAGHGGLLREMGKSMRVEAKPVTDEMKSTVQGLSTRSSRGGFGAREERALYLLRRRKKITAKALRLAHRRSGLRAAAARTVQFQVRTGAKTAAIRIRSNSGLMPAGQRKLPAYMNRGRWGHPVFGNRNNNVVQYVSPNEWFDMPARVKGPQAQQRVVATLQDYIAKSFAG